jgi:hypothetical protein
MIRQGVVVLMGAFILNVVLMRPMFASEQPVLEQERWSADWIWQPNKVPVAFDLLAPTEKNLFVYFRKTFDLSDAALEAVAQVAADSRYKLYINGHYVGRGPIRGDLVWQYYDTYDVARYLHPGRNVIAVLVHSYGEDTGWYMMRRPGLRFQCAVRVPHGPPVVLASGGTWKVLQASAWEQDTPRVNDALGFVEVYEATKEESGWNLPDYDDSNWASAQVVSSTSGESPTIPVSENLIPRSIPMLIEREILPARVLQVAEVRNLSPGSAPTLADQMAQESLQKLKTCKVDNAESVLGTSGSALIQTTPYPASDASNCSVVLVFDFGREVTGYPRIELDGVAGGIIDIGVSEGLVDGRVTPTHNGLHISRYVMKNGPQRFESFEWDGFRYLQMTIRNVPQSIRIQRVTVNFTSYPVGNRGSFESNDQRLNAIWEMARYSIQLTMHDAYEDCPNREQRQWVGDAYVETKVNYAVFGDTKLAAKYLRQIANSQRSDGMVMPFYPGNDAKLNLLRDLNIKEFALNFVSTIWEYYRFTGDEQTLHDVYPSAVNVMEYFSRYIDSNGLVSGLPPWIFGDWVTLDRRGESTIVNALFANTLGEVRQMAKILGDSAREKQYSTMSRRVRSAINARLWDERRGVYVDANVNGSLSRRVSQQSNSLCLLFDIASPQKRPRIVSYIFDKDRAKLDALGLESGTEHRALKEPFDEEHDVVSVQPFFMHWVDAALAHVGDYDRMVTLIREKYGNMIDAGATCTWEVWDPHASQCHGWSATPGYDLMHFVLGIRGVTPGYTVFSVEPHPAGLNSAKGAFPSVQGDILVSWTASASQFNLAVHVPKNTNASVLIPQSAEKNPRELSMNGIVVFQKAKSSSGVAVKEEPDGLRLTLPASGQFEVEARY